MNTIKNKFAAKLLFLFLAFIFLHFFFDKSNNTYQESIKID